MKKFIFTALLVAIATSVVKADNIEFFNTDMPSTTFSIGVRAGVNSTDRTVGRGVFNFWNVNTWGTGVDLGAVADINIRDYITIQPGLFFETRSGKYAYADYYEYMNPSEIVQFGAYRTYNLTIPIVASTRFNISRDVRWSVDFGPYLNLKLGTTGADSFLYNIGTYQQPLYETATSNTADFGFKMGTGVHFLKHYYAGVHYMGGCCRVWNGIKHGGHNKGWTFTVGYDF